MNKIFKFTLIIGLILVVPSLGCGKGLDCSEIKGITMQSYWFNDAELNILNSYRDQEKHSLVAKLKTDPKVCVAASLEAFNEIQSRLDGYKFAIEKWVTLYSLDYHPEKWPQETDIRKRVEELTGISFQSKERIKTWWKENNKYLFWSPEFKRLSVNIEAKKNKKPFLIREKEVIDPTTYWILKIKGDFYDEWRTDKWVYGHVFSSEGDSMRLFDAKLLVSAALNRKAKRNGFHTVLHGYIANNYYGRSYVFNSKTAPKIKQLTGIEFKSYENFTDWWNKNNAKLALSDDGERLVPR
ncbi:MAG: hypothetical protein OEZ51_10500 [Nitrospinota bacterium]|nr:hypothetical protein [Nitrospinota bacterium]